MATPFSNVYNYFLSNITDYSLGELDDFHLEANLQKWLINAIASYPNAKSDLTDFDLTLHEFNEDLSEMEKVVLGKLMAIEYLNPFILDETLLKQTLNSKDYRSYSPAKHLESLQKIKTELNNDISLIISRQSYSVKNLKEMFGNNK